MAFISNGVGNGGKNNTQDVKIIQWMLQTTQYYYGLKIFSRGYGIPENGILDNDTASAVQDVVNYPKIFNIPRFNNSLPNLTKCIFPNDESYRFLIRCSIKPLCVPCDEKIIQFEDNSVARQAIQGRINFITFRYIAEAIEKETICRTLTAKGVEAREKLKNSSIRAFLDMLAVVEGTDKENWKDGIQTGYDVRMGGSLITDLSERTGRVAAGRYQAVPDTWERAKRELGLTDFTPESQDIFGVWGLMIRDMVDDILSDRFAQAIEKGSSEWASLPNRGLTGKDPETNPTSRYFHTEGPRKGQRQQAHSLSRLRGYYDDAKKSYK